jgi:hypothetical protein
MLVILMKQSHALAAFLVVGCICGCTSSIFRNDLAVTTETKVKKANVSVQDILRAVVAQLPELLTVGIRTGPPTPADAWLGGETAVAGFTLPKRSTNSSDASASKGSKMKPADLHLTIARYGSSKDAQQAVEDSLRLRPAKFPPKKKYRGASLYRTPYGVKNAICISGQFVIEIIPYGENADGLTMKVLDVVLSQLPPTSLDPK